METAYQTLLVKPNGKILTITIHRPEANNSMNSQLILEIGQVIDQAESNPEIKIILLQGQNGVFCTGMDFKEVSQIPTDNRAEFEKFAWGYMNLLKRFNVSSKVIISLVDGRANAGGIGFVSACDYVIATPKAEFSLSEALFGLLPANVMPFLVRRIGYQKAFTMTLTTSPIDSGRAYEIGLVDELSAEPEQALRKLLLRVDRITGKTINAMKSYFQKMWIISPEMEKIAVGQLADLLSNPEIVSGIKRFAEQGIFPWQKG